MRLNQPMNGQRAFTLIELMVVIAIIAILAVIGLLVATKVTEGGREAQTRNIIQTLDKTLENYIADRTATKFPAFFKDETGTEFPIIDARRDGVSAERAKKPEPSLQLWLLAAGEAPSVQSAIGAITGRFSVPNYDPTQDELSPMPSAITSLIVPVQRRDEDDDPVGSSGSIVRDELVYSSAFDRVAMKKNASGPLIPFRAPQIRDPWGNVIRMVHPRFQGGAGKVLVSNPGGSPTTLDREVLSYSYQEGGRSQTMTFRRSRRPENSASSANSVGDADEGLCAGSRPYFYSPGPDKDPGKRRDNVYSEPPQFPEETRRDLE